MRWFSWFSSRSHLIREGRSCSVDRDHDVGGLDHQADAAVHLDAEFVDRLACDRGRHDISADVDANMRSGRAFLDFDYDTPDVVACANAHDEFLVKVGAWSTV